VRVIVLGGTRFIGRAVVADLEFAGHEVLVVHRGEHEPAPASRSAHLHVERARLRTFASELEAFRPDCAVDISAKCGRDADDALQALPSELHHVALSSGDVYRAFSSLHRGAMTDAVPLPETAPTRERRFVVAADDENLEVEERYLALDGTVLRLGAVYGEHDYQRRHEFVLRRVRAGRTRIPIGAANFLFSRCYVGDVAQAVRLAVELRPRGEIFNVVERATWTIGLLALKIIEASGAATELVRVDDRLLPDDLRITGLIEQHLLMDSHKVRSGLGWEETDPDKALVRTVEWDLANPPDAEYLAGIGSDPDDFSADEAALCGDPH
jgi:nucleoside-diphosphate-sugar epimerase